MSLTSGATTDTNNIGNSPYDRFGNVRNVELVKSLVEKQIIDQVTGDTILENAAKSGKSVEEIVLSGIFIRAKKLQEAKSVIFNIPYIDLDNTIIPVETLQKVNSEVAKKYQVVAYEDSPDVLKVAMVDPTDIQKIRYLTTLVGKRVESSFGDPEIINKIIDTRYGTQVGAEVSRALEDVGDTALDIQKDSEQLESLKGDIASAPVTRIVNSILDYAAKIKASDIHIEPREAKLVVRNRIHGVLSEKLVLPIRLASAVVSRIKILADLKIDEHRMPQDGRFQIKADDSFIDIRVSIIPTVYGEKVVMRLLEKGGGSIDLEKTGINGRNLDEFSKAIHKTTGIVLVTGPTGSGKTVTLASCLKILNKESVNIITLEDPVEIMVDGVNQVQVNPDVGLTFAKGLRSFLRQDPNIIMVGEIRDRETAELAVQAALTGHLVLATLHTNSASTAIPRLIDMGVEPFLLATTMNVVAAQRLVRTVCDNCPEEHAASEEEIVKIKQIISNLPSMNIEEMLQKNQGRILLKKGRGCDLCNRTGYKGRTGIFEVLSITEKIRSMVISHETAQNIQKVAIEETGMSTMIQDGIFKVLEGITTIEEVLRVVG